MSAPATPWSPNSRPLAPPRCRRGSSSRPRASGCALSTRRPTRCRSSSRPSAQPPRSPHGSPCCASTRCRPRRACIDALPAVLDVADRSVSQARVALAAAEAERAKQNEELQRAAPQRERACATGSRRSTRTCTGSRCRRTRRSCTCRRCSSAPPRSSGSTRRCSSPSTGPRCRCRSTTTWCRRPSLDDDAVELDADVERAEPGRLCTRRRQSPFDRSQAAGAPRLGGAQARTARPGQPARPRGVRRARAAPQVPHRAARRPDGDPQRPADDHRRDRREDAGHLRGGLRRHAGRVQPGVPGAVPRRNRQPVPDRPRRTAHHRHRGHRQARQARRSSGCRCSPVANARWRRSRC